MGQLKRKNVKFKNPFTIEDFPKGSLFYLLKPDWETGTKIQAKAYQVHRVVSVGGYWRVKFLHPKITKLLGSLDNLDRDRLAEWEYILLENLNLEIVITPNGRRSWNTELIVPEETFKALRGESTNPKTELEKILGTGVFELDQTIKKAKVVKNFS